MTSPVLLILGAGGNVGQSTAKKFAQNGYKIALVARSLENGTSEEGYLTIKGDLAEPECVPKIFKEVQEKLGIPNVVVHSAFAFTWSPENDPLFLPYATMKKEMAVNFESVYLAAQEAVRCFETLSAAAAQGSSSSSSEGIISSLPKVFIFTGNMLNVQTFPAFLSLGLGKTAGAFMVECADIAYSKRGYRFYYADERSEEGGAIGTAINGDAHADMYHELVFGTSASVSASAKKRLPWLITFVKGRGYVYFPRQESNLTLEDLPARDQEVKTS